jgi:hypothetical protein
MYYMMVKAAGGVISEKRFSGEDDLTPNEHQVLWHFFNLMLDNDQSLDMEDIKDFSDYQLWEMSKHMPIDLMAKKFYDTTPEQLQERLQKFAVTLSALQVLHPTLVKQFSGETQSVKKPVKAKEKF